MTSVRIAVGNAWYSLKKLWCFVVGHDGHGWVGFRGSIVMVLCHRCHAQIGDYHQDKDI